MKEKNECVIDQHETYQIGSSINKISRKLIDNSETLEGGEEAGRGRNGRRLQGRGQNPTGLFRGDEGWQLERKKEKT